MAGQIQGERNFNIFILKPILFYLKMKNKRDKIINRFSLGHKIFCKPSVKRMKNKNVGFNTLETFPELTHSLKNERELSWDNKEILPGDLKNQEPVPAADFSLSSLGSILPCAHGWELWLLPRDGIFEPSPRCHSADSKTTTVTPVSLLMGKLFPLPPTSSLQPPSNEYFSIDTKDARFLRLWAAAGVCVQRHRH